MYSRDQYYNSVLPNLHEDIIVIDKDYGITDINSSYKNITGYKPKDIIGKKCYEIFHHKDKPCDQYGEKCELQNVFNIGKPINNCHIHKHKNGSNIHVESRLAPIKDHNGRVSNVAVTIHDISKRRKLEIERKKLFNEYKERVKELNCLFKLSKIIEDPAISLDRILRKIIKIIPSSWQYPDITCVRIILDNKEYKSDNYKETVWKQKNDIKINRKNRGIIEVSYLEERPELYDGPFLKEEWDLISALAEQLGQAIEHKKIEEEERTILELTQFIYSTDDLDGLLQNLTLYLKKWSGCSSVGIRFKHGYDYPYFETRGFPEEFVRKENSLCVYEKGDVLKDSKGNSVLECMCGNIILGRFDPSLPFFTENGSFWSNCTTDLLASTTEEERQARTRNTCNGEGYESVALIPLRAEKSNYGLLQFNDKRKGMFTKERIALFERIAYNISMTIAQRETAESFRESEARYRMLLESISDSVFVFDYQWQLIVTNNAAASFVRISKEALLGRKVTDIFPGIRKTKFFRAFQNVMKERKPGTVIDKYSFSNEEEGWYEIHVYPVQDGIMCILRDVTEQKKIQQQLIHLEKLSAVGQLAAGIAHEFNNILSIIQARTQLSLLDPAKDEITGSLKIIEKSTRRGSNLVSDMMAFSRPQKLKFQFGYINKVIDEVINMQKKQLSLENIKITKKDLKYSKIFFDKGQLQQVFLNLLINARHAIQPKGKGRICVTTEKVNGHIQIKFSDTGIGMDEETKKKIFEPFFTTKSAFSKDDLKIKGSGLGLSVTHTIIQQHKGKIEVESKKGIGTTFIISLPTLRVEPRKVIKSKKSRLTNNKTKIKDIKILIVDDEKDMANSMKIILQISGYKNVFVRYNGEQALNVVKKIKPDIIFSDLVMPGMDGEQLMREIRSMGLKVPIVFMSGKLLRDKKRLLNKGAFAFIKKPFDIDEILNVVNKK